MYDKSNKSNAAIIWTRSLLDDFMLIFWFILFYLFNLFSLLRLLGFLFLFSYAKLFFPLFRQVSTHFIELYNILICILFGSICYINKSSRQFGCNEHFVIQIHFSDFFQNLHALHWSCFLIKFKFSSLL